MNLVGTLVVLVSLHVVFASQSNPGHLSSVSVESGQVQKLASVVRNLADFKLDGFKSDSFYRVGNVGKYLSRDLLNYMKYGNVDPRTNGMIITAHYSNTLPPLATKDRTVGYLINGNGVDSEFKAGFTEYLKRLHRDKRQTKK